MVSLRNTRNNQILDFPFKVLEDILLNSNVDDDQFVRLLPRARTPSGLFCGGMQLICNCATSFDWRYR